MTFVNGIGEESDVELEAALDDFDKEGETGNQPEIYTHTIMSENESDILASFSLYDNAINSFDEDEEKYYYVYRNRCAASYDDQTKFAEAKELTFSVYYLNDTDESGAHLENIVEGTFKANLNDSKTKVLEGMNIYEASNNYFLEAEVIEVIYDRLRKAEATSKNVYWIVLDENNPVIGPSDYPPNTINKNDNAFKIPLSNRITANIPNAVLIPYNIRTACFCENPFATNL